MFKKKDVPYTDMELERELFVWDYEGRQFRAVVIDGEAWFVARDAAVILGYINTREAIKNLVDDDDKAFGIVIFDFMRRERKPVFVNESGLSSLICASEYPDAKKFKMWIAEKVMPAIRRKGSYFFSSRTSPQYSRMINAEQKISEQESRINELFEKFELLRSRFAVDRDNWRKECRDILARCARTLDNDYSYIGQIYEEAYSLLESRAGVCLSARLKNMRGRMAVNGSTAEKVKGTTNFDVIDEDKKLREIFISVVQEMAIKYGVKEKEDNEQTEPTESAE